MKTVVEGIERFALNQGWNVIQCDNCPATQALERTHDVQKAISEARDRGWMVLDNPRRDLCPVCADGLLKSLLPIHLKG